MSEMHEIKQLITYETGASEWRCDDCGRHFILQPKPFRRIILCPGNEEAGHHGGNMSVQLGTNKLSSDQSDRNSLFDSIDSVSKKH